MAAGKVVEKSAAQRPGGVTGKGFVKGVSGNPGGRPKGVAELLAHFRANCTPERMDALFRGLYEIATEDDDPKARVAATKELLDRLVGKPQQSVELSGTVEGLTAEERRERVLLLVAEAAARKEGK